MTDWSEPKPPEQEQPASSPYGPPSTAPAYAPGGQPELGGTPAEWWRRLVAIILDWLILSVPNSILTALLGLSAFEMDSISDEVTLRGSDLGAMTLISLIIACLYSGVLEGGRHGASVGKMALRIQVRDADGGGPIGFGRAALRRFIYQVLFVPFLVPGLINGLSPLWDRRKQAWHDKAVKSVVVGSPRT
jgi:uncharacterized RDD family membrane protein YckC